MTTGDHFTSKSASYVFLAELGLSGTLLLAITGTVLLSPSIHRSAISVNLYVAFIIYCFSYLLLPITGQWNNLEPPFGLYLFSAVGNYASFPLCAAAVLALSLSLWLSVCHRNLKHASVANYSMIIAPYIVWVAVSLEALTFGLSQRAGVVRHGYPYCFIENNTPGTTSRALLAILLLPGMVLQGFTFYRLFSVSNPFRENPGLRHALRQRVVRMAVFSLGSIGALGLTVSFSIHSNNVPQVIVQGVCPLWAVLAFGTQKEILQTWIRWVPVRRSVSGITESNTNLVTVVELSPTQTYGKVNSKQLHY